MVHEQPEEERQMEQAYKAELAEHRAAEVERKHKEAAAADSVRLPTFPAAPTSAILRPKVSKESRHLASDPELATLGRATGILNTGTCAREQKRTLCNAGLRPNDAFASKAL